MTLTQYIAAAIAAVIVITLTVSVIGLLGLGFWAVADFLCMTPKTQMLIILAASGAAAFIAPHLDEEGEE